MKEKKQKESTSGKAVWICAALPVAALLVIVGIIIYPSVMARRERTKLADRLDTIAAAGDAAVLVTGMSDFGYGTEADSGESYTEGSEAAEYVRVLAAELRGAKYLRREDAAGGNWDLRVRATGGGESVTLYRTEGDEIYFTRGITRFVFRTAE